MNADVLAELMTILRPALRALSEGSRTKAETAFARFEVDAARWAARHGVTPAVLDRTRAALESDDTLRRAVHEAVTEPDHVRGLDQKH
jgi:hypothetical protein